MIVDVTADYDEVIKADFVIGDGGSWVVTADYYLSGNQPLMFD